MLVFFARLVAILVHSSIFHKRRYTNEPYWHHLCEVVEILKTHGIYDKHMLAAAWLHDTVEDTWMRHSMIRLLFGKKVSQYVVGLTDVTTLEDGNRKVRKAIEADRLAATCSAVQSIKVADLISNTKSISYYDWKFLKKAYLSEVIALSKRLDKANPTLRLTLDYWITFAEGIVRNQGAK